MRPCIGKLPAGYLPPSGVTYGAQMFSSVVVVTDRLSLDQNIKKTISQLSKVTGQVVMIGRDERGNAVSDGSKSSQLVEALRQKREIVVVTKRSGPFFTSMALRPWARPSWYSIGRV